MPTFRETRMALLHAHDQQLINRSKNFDFPYWNYTRFDLNEWTNDECLADFMFHKADVYRLFHALHIPAQITTYNRSLYDGLEAFCVFLKRCAYPCRYSDLVPRFRRPVPELCMMSNSIIIVIRNGKIVWKHGPNRPFFLYNLSSENY